MALLVEQAFGALGSTTSRAIERGFDFLRSTAENPIYLPDYGDDLLWCFYSISTNSADPELRIHARVAGELLARRWTAQASVPPAANADVIAQLVFGAYAASQFGVRDTALKSTLQRAAKRFSTNDFLGFDARRGPPPKGDSRYDTWCDALITSYTGDLFGILLGARWRDVVRWLPAMRPYAVPQDGAQFTSILNAVTHTVYTFNGYNARALHSDDLRPEFEFLLTALPQAEARRNPEMVGEILDTLRSFGLTPDNPQIRQAQELLLSWQNNDGSWGNPQDPDIYNRYHATWTAIDGLRDYRYFTAAGGAGPK